MLLPVSIVHYFCLLSSISLYSCSTIVHPFSYWEHLGYFCSLVIKENTLTNIHVDMYRHVLSFLLGKEVREQWPGHTEVGLLLVLLFSKLPNCFLKCWYHITFPSAVNNSFSCPTFWPIPSRISLFSYGHSIGCLVVTHCGFIFL